MEGTGYSIRTQYEDVGLAQFAHRSVEQLADEDPILYDLIVREHRRQSGSLLMVAAASMAPPSVLACQGTVLGNVTTEGYPGNRFHAGCEIVDHIERLAIERAMRAFGARYANVQPHSGTSANQAVLFSVLQPGDTLLGMELNAGGHLSHGARASVSGRYFNGVQYGVDDAGYIDYDQVQALARKHRPKLIVCGASAYPRAIDFARFRQIADDVGAYLLADISHIAGLVVCGLHPSPIDHAHFTTTSTYKQLCGPRGGLVLIGRDADVPRPDGRGTLADLIQHGMFPRTQGTPNEALVAAKARALDFVVGPEFRAIAHRVARGATTLAARLAASALDVLTGGTDNHIVLVDLRPRRMTGLVAERALEECHVIVNKNRIPHDRKPATVTSGLRLGSNGMAIRGMEPPQVGDCAELLVGVLEGVTAVADDRYRLDAAVRARARDRVADLCARHPVPWC